MICGVLKIQYKIEKTNFYIKKKQKKTIRINGNADDKK